LGGKSEGNLRVSYAATAGTATSATTANTANTANTATTATTASGLTTAVWNQIRAMIPEPIPGTNPGGGGSVTRTGTNVRGGYVYFDTPFPNACISVSPSNCYMSGVNASSSAPSVSSVSRTGFYIQLYVRGDTGGQEGASVEGYFTDFTFNYTAYGN
jgi:hypothetical protein